jgi:hypothetical protein
MFLRSKVVKGRTYHQVVESYRDEGRVRQRTLASLGTHPTIEAARTEALSRYLTMHPAHTRRQGAWFWVRHLDDLARAWHVEKGTAYQGDDRLEAEQRRRQAEWRKQREHAGAERARRNAGRQDQDREFDEAFGARARRRNRDELYQDLKSLGLLPTEDQIKAAYRRQARECHPDHGGSNEAMTEVNAIYERLSTLRDDLEDQA